MPTRPLALGAPFPLGRQPWRTLDPFLFCAYHNDQYPAAAEGTLGPDRSLLRGRQMGSDFSYQDGWSMYHGQKIPGFPSHPHRGFETITCAMQGLVDHFDSLGATGRYGNGDVQWLTTGDGVQHSEMFPLLSTKEANPAELFQLWLNLPAKSKTAPPYFSMFWDNTIPRVPRGDAEVTVIAGGNGMTGAESDRQPCAPPPDSWAADERNEVAVWVSTMTKAGGSVTLPEAKYGKEINRVLYFFRGDATAIEITAHGRDPLMLRKGHGIPVDASTSLQYTAVGGKADVLLLQGRPIEEPVVQHGPFVLNTKAELAKTFEMFQRTQFGGWPWPSSDHTHPREQRRFARRPGAKENEYPPE